MSGGEQSLCGTGNERPRDKTTAVDYGPGSGQDTGCLAPQVMGDDL